MTVNRLETYNRLADTYTSELNKATEAITALDVEIANLEHQLAVKKMAKTVQVAERHETAQQLMGVNALIRQMEDATLDQQRQAYDAAIAQY